MATQDWFSQLNLIMCLLLPLHHQPDLFISIQQLTIKILLCARQSAGAGGTRNSQSHHQWVFNLVDERLIHKCLLSKASQWHLKDETKAQGWPRRKEVLGCGKWGEIVEEVSRELAMRRQDVVEFAWQRLKGRRREKTSSRENTICRICKSKNGKKYWVYQKTR